MISRLIQSRIPTIPPIRVLSSASLKTSVRFYSDASSLSSPTTGTTSDELSHFSKLAESWWDVNGPQRILHKMNLVRLDFVLNLLKGNWNKNSATKTYIPGYSFDLLPDENLREKYTKQVQDHENTLFDPKSPDSPRYNVLDIGCGGGILSECLARLPFTSHVLGIDLSPDVIEVAKAHMAKDPKLAGKLDYRLMELSKLDPKAKKYDIITLFEVLEHVEYPAEILSQALDRLNPGGWMFLSTMNRTAVSYFTTILVGEYLLKVVPKGTHTLSKYINEQELREWFGKRNDCDVISSEGCIYIPAYGWKLTGPVQIGNYFMAIRKKD